MTTLGIVGGGQLGRMLALAAARLGIRVIVLDPQPDAPAAQVANEQLVAGYDDVEALRDLADRTDVVTYEFENVPAAGLDAVEATLRPGRRALAVSQDRLEEKTFLESIGLDVAPWHRVDDQAGLVEAVGALGGRAVVKTRRLGYDGKGQLRIDDGAVPADAFDALGSVPLVAEGFVEFDAEISVIGARSVDGVVRRYDPAANTHEDGILARSVVPAGVAPAAAEAAGVATERLLHGLDYVGVVGVEFFVVGERVLVNEFAPRVHNSGHWTEAACLCSQFEQHVRAVCGLPLGDPRRHDDAEMVNLLGDPTATADRLLASGDWMVHLYGKGEARPGRKMGHATRLG